MRGQLDSVSDQAERQPNGRRRAGLLGVLLLASAGPAAAGDALYTVAVNEKLSRMSVEARFADPVARLAARDRDAARFLDAATNCDAGDDLRTDGPRLVLPAQGIRCLSYTVDLEAAALARRHRGGEHSGTVAVAPASWLWRPRLSDVGEITVHFNLPAGIDVFVPWQPVTDTANSFTLRGSPRSGHAAAVFGSYYTTTRRLQNTEIRIALLRDRGATGNAALADWVRDTASNVALAYGRFPTPAVSVLLIPVDRNSSSTSAVGFGRIVRDGGESVEVLINPNRPIDEFHADWTLTHEFAHLMLPYLARGQRWVAEGFATYYQNLLLARAGRYSEEQAWAKLLAGFERGRNSVPSLSPNAAASGAERNTRMKIYWSGAALALLADVELRRLSGGRESLDGALDKLQRCCLPSQRSWSGPELFATLDTLVAEPVFTALYSRYANRSGFPTLAPLLDQLGVHKEDGEIRLSESAELASIRRAIFAVPEGPDA